MNASTRNFGLIAQGVPPDQTAIIDLSEFRPRLLTYADFRMSVQAVAGGLVSHGIGQGDRIGVLSLNRAEYLIVLFGAALAGAVAVPLNVKLPADTLRELLRVDAVRLIFAEHQFTRLAPQGTPVVRFGAEYRAFLKFGTFDDVAAGGDDIAMQLYTSGSSGLPKGVLLTHAGQIWAAETLTRHRRLTAADRTIVAAPFYHKNAVVAAKTTLASGGSMIVMPHFDAGNFAHVMAEWDVTILTSVPTMLRLLLDDPCLPPDAVRQRVRVVSIDSAPAPERLLTDIAYAFPNAEIHLNYGVTEGGPVMFGWYHPEGKPRPLTSIGYPMPGCEWRLDGARPDEGEFWVRNPGVAKGYFNRPEATADSFEDGWYRTGDILRRDGDGWFYFVARTDDLMVTSGENMFPQEIQETLEAHPAVLQAAVIGVRYELKGEVPVAFVVLEEGRDADAAAVRQFALDNAPAYAYPSQIIFLPSLPLTSTHKIDKAVLTQLAQDDTARNAKAGSAGRS